MNLVLKNILLVLLVCVFIGCGTDEASEEMSCTSSEIAIQNVNVTTASCGSPEGALTVEASGGSGIIQYSIDEVNFQSSGTFSNLTPGLYIITAKDESECAETLEVSLPSMISFSQVVKPIIEAKCAISGCHVAGVQAPDLSEESNIFSAAPRIKSQVETGAMPQGDDRTLTKEEIESVICWFTDGTKNN